MNGVTPAALLFLIAMLAGIFILPRRAVVVPVLLTTVLMTIGQQFEVGGAHFYFLRIVIIAAWFRVIIRREAAHLSLNLVDKAFLLWALVAMSLIFVPKPVHPSAVMPSLELGGMVVRAGGITLDALGTFFLMRHLLRGSEDISFALSVMIWLCIALAVFMTIEKITRHNMFSVFGVVPDITVERDGRLRCQGPFTHPIHAGNYGSTLVPLCLGLWLGTKKRLALAGVVAATVVTIASASSGPLMAWVFGILAFAFWQLRHQMRSVRWSLLGLTILLHLVMKAPVWWAIARVSEIVGGGGYWRAKLIDQFVNHFSEWWLVGTTYTAHWSPTGVGLPDYPDQMDLTNQFVAEGVAGGLLRLILFIFILFRCFQRIGQSVRFGSEGKERFVYWGLGCGLVAYVAAFLAVAGSMQTDILFYVLLALISITPGIQPAGISDPAQPPEEFAEDQSLSLRPTATSS